MTTVLICEDDLSQLQQIDSIVRNYIIFHDNQFQLGIPTQDPYEILKYVQKFSINGGIYFLDIDLKNSIDGIELAKKISKIDLESRFIFITTHDEMAITAMQQEIRAFNFILKDQNLDEFMNQVRETLISAQIDIEKSRHNHNESFSFHVGNVLTNLDMDDVIYLTSSEVPHQVDLYTYNGRYSFYSKLNDIEKKYKNFFRAKRSCLVNIRNIKQVDYSSHVLELKNNVSMSFSMRKSKELRELLI